MDIRKKIQEQLHDYAVMRLSKPYGVELVGEVGSRKFRLMNSDFQSSVAEDVLNEIDRIWKERVLG